MSEALLNEAAIRRRSLVSAVLTAIGAAAIAGSLFYATSSVVDARHQRDALQRQAQQLASQVNDLRRNVAEQTRTLEQSRCALDNSRQAVERFHNRDYDGAIALYDQALKCDPKNAYILNLSAYANFKAGRLPQAIQLQQASLAADPTYAWGYFDLARFQCAEGGAGRAAAAHTVSQALSLRPDLEVIIRSDGEFQRLCHGQQGAAIREGG